MRTGATVHPEGCCCLKSKVLSVSGHPYTAQRNISHRQLCYRVALPVFSFSFIASVRPSVTACVTVGVRLFQRRRAVGCSAAHNGSSYYFPTAYSGEVRTIFPLRITGKFVPFSAAHDGEFVPFFQCAQRGGSYHSPAAGLVSVTTRKPTLPGYGMDGIVNTECF